MDPEVEANSRLAVLEGGYRGHDGMRRWWNDLFDAFPDLDTEIVDVGDRGDLTIVEVRQSGHGAGSQSPVNQRAWVVTRWHDKKVVWWKTYEVQAEALEAVGQRE